MTAAKAIREEYRGKTPPAAHSVRMNLRIIDVPFGEGVLNAHIDSSSGELEMELGHLENPELTVGLDYGTAKAILVEQDPQAGMQAFMLGKVKVEGDLTKLLAFQAVAPDETAIAMAARLKEITE
jgi:putative sterol carrier protein